MNPRRESCGARHRRRRASVDRRGKRRGVHHSCARQRKRKTQPKENSTTQHRDKPEPHLARTSLRTRDARKWPSVSMTVRTLALFSRFAPS
jgi:hypothetical protein